MSKIIYLLGAGASRGIRDTNKHRMDYYVSGMPIMSEIKECLERFCSSFRPLVSFVGESSSTKYPTIYKEMTWLLDISKNNPSLDTYAKKLYTKGQINELSRLKRAIAIFFSLIQSKEKRDMRYDSFMETVVDERGKLNSQISILTWNYDRQCEFAFHEYEITHTSSSHQYPYAHIACKGYSSQYINYQDSNLVKLNGMASFKPINSQYLLDEEDYTIENFERIFSYNSDKYTNFISYAWEEDNDFIDKVLPLTSDTEVLVIIGYSMPTVNINVDKKLLYGMNHLKSIVIQGKDFETVKGRLLNLFDEDKKKILADKISFESNLDSFYIPVNYL